MCSRMNNLETYLNFIINVHGMFKRFWTILYALIIQNGVFFKVFVQIILDLFLICFCLRNAFILDWIAIILIQHM